MSLLLLVIVRLIKVALTIAFMLPIIALFAVGSPIVMVMVALATVSAYVNRK